MQYSLTNLHIYGNPIAFKRSMKNILKLFYYCRKYFIRNIHREISDKLIIFLFIDYILLNCALYTAVSMTTLFIYMLMRYLLKMSKSFNSAFSYLMNIPFLNATTLLQICQHFWFFTRKLLLWRDIYWRKCYY